MTTHVARSLGRGGVAALLALALVVGVAPDAQSQERGGRGGGEMLQEQIRERFGALVRRELGLDRDAQEALTRVFRRFHEQRRDLMERRMELRREIGGRIELRDAVRGESPPLLADDEARVVIDAMIDLQEEEARLFREEQEVLLEILTPAQLVRFHALREAFAERVRAIRSRGPGPGGVGLPAPGGPRPGGRGPGGVPLLR